MAKFCDRSPCDSLLQSIGHFIHGHEHEPQFLLQVHVDGKQKLVPIGYCPYCGTRLEPEWCREMLNQMRTLGAQPRLVANKRVRAV